MRRAAIDAASPGGVGNINTSPDFIDPDGLDDVPGNSDDDFRLQSGSPCIDAGGNSEIPAGVAGDMDEYIRIFRCVVDMGAYEAQNGFANPDGDVNCDDNIDLADLSVTARAWLSTQGQANYNIVCDLFDDNTIDISDLAVIGNRWLSVPSAPTVVNAAVTRISFYSARLNGEVTDNGGQDPIVTVYWGDEDGGTTPGNWDNAETIGTQDSTFIDKLNSLSHGAMYYFRAYAENSGGGDWADSTASFATEALIAPTVIVSSATDITASTATLHGEVTDIGADNPSVAFYYGDDDAGEVAGNWDYSVSMGVENSTFSTDIVGLAEGTTYYYRAFAESSAGSDWSDVAGFATLTDGAWIFDVAGSGTGASFTPDGSQTERFDLRPSSSTVAGSTRAVPTAGTVTNGWTAGNDHRMCLSMAAFAPVDP